MHIALVEIEDRGRSVTIAAKLGTVRSGVRIPVGARGFFFPPKRPDRLSCPASLHGVPAFFLGG
jgi:hypothetical protein